MPTKRDRMSRVLSLWLPVFLWMLVILAFSSNVFSAGNTGGVLRWILESAGIRLEPPSFEIVHGIVRKSAHVVEYAILGLLARRAFSGTRASPAAEILAVALALACASLDESLQAASIRRTGALLDVLVDGIGAATGVLAHGALDPLRRRRSGRFSVAVESERIRGA